MSLNQVLNKLRKMFTFKQFSEITDLLHAAAEISRHHGIEQEVRVTFINGHPRNYTATHNHKASLPETGIDDGINWEVG